MKRLLKQCSVCKIAFEMAYGQSYCRWEKQKFCSKQCQGVFNRKSEPLVERKKCEICLSSFKRSPSFSIETWNKQIFCSKSCARRKLTSTLKKDRVKECLICGSSFESVGRRGKSWETAKFCSSACYEIEASVFMSTVRYRGKENWVWRKLVLERDKMKCQIGNRDCKGSLTVHHILRYSEFPELRYEPNNGITLCRHHHPLKREHEKSLIPVFTKLVQENGY